MKIKHLDSISKVKWISGSDFSTAMVHIQRPGLPETHNSAGAVQYNCKLQFTDVDEEEVRFEILAHGFAFDHLNAILNIMSQYDKDKAKDAAIYARCLMKAMSRAGHDFLFEVTLSARNIIRLFNVCHNADLDAGPLQATFYGIGTNYAKSLWAQYFDKFSASQVQVIAEDTIGKLTMIPLHHSHELVYMTNDFMDTRVLEVNTSSQLYHLFCKRYAEERHEYLESAPYYPLHLFNYFSYFMTITYDPTTLDGAKYCMTEFMLRKPDTMKDILLDSVMRHSPKQNAPFWQYYWDCYSLINGIAAFVDIFHPTYTEYYGLFKQQYLPDTIIDKYILGFFSKSPLEINTYFSPVLEGGYVAGNPSGVILFDNYEDAMQYLTEVEQDVDAFAATNPSERTINVMQEYLKDTIEWRIYTLRIEYMRRLGNNPFVDQYKCPLYRIYMSGCMKEDN